ncbi:M23 family metallopeptidase [Microbacterium indicum]|uniref:M23 family metallopeptidase n=1 Tax=Microbacterium indicum TaxID=358100 RepID=UPI00040F708C|nr:M23 family metallopeptidase [Microbacterium indicum]
MTPENSAAEPARPLTRRELRERRAAGIPVVDAPEEQPVAASTMPNVAETTEPASADAFSDAAGALGFTGRPAPVRTAAPAPTRRARPAAKVLRTPFRRFAAATGSLAALGAVALLAVGTTIPIGSHAIAEAAVTTPADDASAADQTVAEAAGEQLQGYVAGSDIAEQPLDHIDGYSASTYASVASADGISTANAFYTNDPMADVQYPFVVGTSMSSGYGMRWGRLHEGIDFTPGEGAPVQAIADGVVRTATEAGGAYGVTVYIDHIIDGQLVTSHYAHMLYGSLQVEDGDTVEVGDVIGNVGNTGRSYGAHMHFEIIINGSTTDPQPWLEEHAGERLSKEDRAAMRAAETEQLGAVFDD